MEKEKNHDLEQEEEQVEEKTEVHTEVKKPKETHFLQTKRGGQIASIIVGIIALAIIFFVQGPAEPVVFNLPPLKAIGLLSIVLSMFVTLVYKFMTDQVLMRELKKDLKKEYYFRFIVVALGAGALIIGVWILSYVPTIITLLSKERLYKGQAEEIINSELSADKKVLRDLIIDVNFISRLMFAVL